MSWKDLFNGAKSIVGDVAKAARDSIDEAQSKDRPNDYGAPCIRSGGGALPGELPPSISIFVGTWNMFGSSISSRDRLEEWLLPGHERGQEIAAGVPDIVVLGLQELCDLNPANCLLKAAGDFEREDEFDAQVLACLGRLGRYGKIRSVGMIGLYVACFARVSLLAHINEVDADRLRTVTEGLAGKKGGVAVRFSLGGKSLCFVNVHLPSGHEKAEDRSATLRQVMGEGFRGVNLQGGARPSKLGFKRESCYAIGAHSADFVLGDFNFRLKFRAEELPKRIAELTAEDCTALRAFDPSLCGTVDPALVPFSEGLVEFPPTYKYQVGSDTFDERRLPAWTDRIFFKGDCINQSLYRSHMGLRNTSDHRPVTGLFTMRLQDATASSSR